MKKLGNILWGIVLIVVGVIFGLNALEITDINVFFDGWWTLFIIVPSLIGLIKEEDKTGALIGLLIGIVLLLCCRDVLSFGLIWKLIIPVILVIVGLYIIFKDTFQHKVRKEMEKLNKSDKNSYCSTFGSQTINFDEEEFKGCELNSIFGGIKLDLTKAILKEDVVIHASSIFGSITICMPSDMKVKVVSTSIFGGVDNKYKNTSEKTCKVIYINATCVFGGIDIK